MSITLRTRLGLPHPSTTGIPWCECTHPIDPMGIPPLTFVHGNGCIGTHDVIRDTFVAIARNVGFQVGWEKLNVLPSTTFTFSHWQVDIVLTKDGIRTLVDIVISNPTQANLFPRSCAIQWFVAFNATQTKERSYCNQHSTNRFLPSTNGVFGCLHKHVNVFLHDSANAIWSLKGLEGLHLFTLVTFLR